MPRDRPRIWESFKRALGSSSREGPSYPDLRRSPADEAPPFLSRDEPPVATVPGQVTPVREEVEPVVADAVRAADEVGTAVDPPPEEPRVEPNVGDSNPVTAIPEAAASRSPRLARGLASFSRDNADREKKFRHILSDGDAGGAKKR